MKQAIKIFANSKLNMLVIMLGILFVEAQCTKSPPAPVPGSQIKNGFANPIIGGADPSVFQKDGFYYYTHTTGNNVSLWKTNALSKLSSTQPRVIYTPPSGSQNSSNIWAAEFYYLDNKWYAYYTAGNGADESQRIWVLENPNADPTTGTWTDKGRIFNTNADFWAIDGSIMEYKNERYLLWCGRPYIGGPSDITQNIYISKMSSPTTLTGPVTSLTQPTFSWERNGFGVNEGPQIYKSPAGRYFIIYSASYCGTDDYALGMLSLATDADPMNAQSWTKASQPVFSKQPSSNAYGPGHNSFFKSPDGSQDWIIYHANPNTNQGCNDKRTIRMQKFGIKADGAPDFGVPVATGLRIEKPAGEN